MDGEGGGREGGREVWMGFFFSMWGKHRGQLEALYEYCTLLIGNNRAHHNSVSLQQAQQSKHNIHVFIIALH